MRNAVALRPVEADAATDALRQLLALDTGVLNRAFRSATPFPHVLVDIELSEALTSAFPGPDWNGWTLLRDQYQPHKRHCPDIEQFPPSLQRVVEGLNGSRAVQWLERVTGIDGLIPDPHLTGGGLHASTAGGILSPHTDFHDYGRLGVSRRINLLLYMNPGWTSADGGCLELFHPGTRTAPAMSVVPAAGRIVIFETNDQSPHGFTVPVAAGKTRNSVALYFYTARRPDHFSGTAATGWAVTSAPRARVRWETSKALRRIASGFGKLAYHLDPFEKESSN